MALVKEAKASFLLYNKPNRCTLYNDSCTIIIGVSLILGGEFMEENMTRWELLTLLLSIKGLLETDNKDKALEVINEVIAESKRNNNN